MFRNVYRKNLNMTVDDVKEEYGLYLKGILKHNSI